MNIAPSPIQLRSYFGNSVAVRADVESAVLTEAVNRLTGQDLKGPARGFAIDMDGDGVATKQDGFLAFPKQDGKYDVTEANDLLKAFGSGNFDFDGDGKVSEAEKSRGGALSERGKQMDLDGDGILNNWELQKAGAVVIKAGKDENGEAVVEFARLPGMDGPNQAEQMQIQMMQFQMAQQQMMGSYFQNFMMMQQSMMMGPMSGMGMFGGVSGMDGSFGGYPMGLAMPIY